MQYRGIVSPMPKRFKLSRNKINLLDKALTEIVLETIIVITNIDVFRYGIKSFFKSFNTKRFNPWSNKLIWDKSQCQCVFVFIKRSYSITCIQITAFSLSFSSARCWRAACTFPTNSAFFFLSLLPNIMIKNSANLLQTRKKIRSCQHFSAIFVPILGSRVNAMKEDTTWLLH